MAMHILSINAAKPRTFDTDDGEKFETAIFKEPVAGRVWARDNAIDGDEPADKEDHGGEFKAVYTYASEHYAFWKGELGRADMPYGMFGENLTTAGLDEDAVRLGDRFRMGEALLEAAQPRLPCETLGFRFRDQSIVKRFLQACRMGIYFKIVEEGRLAAGDEIRLEKKGKSSVSMAELMTLFAAKKADKKRLREILKLPELTPEFRGHFERRL
ncbi:MAG: MOSC domain-containing protein [Elusimicrobiota bacterium]